MNNPLRHLPGGEEEVRWEQAREFLRLRLSRSLDRADPETVQDLTQEALLRLLRTLRRERARNLEALMTEIARRTYVDFIRRRRVRSAHFVPLDDASEAVADPGARPSDEIGDPVQRVRFIVLQFFRTRRAKCLALARGFFSGRDWASLADDSGLSHDATRQQWSRCLELLRRHATSDTGLLRAWAQIES